MTVLGAVALYYIIGILSDIRDITDRVRRGSEQLGEDLETLRDNIKEEGKYVRHIATFVGRRAGWFPPEKKPRRKSKKSGSGNTEGE